MAIDVYLQVDGIKGEFSKIRVSYTQQKVAGGAGGSTIGGWDLATNRIAI